MGAAPLGLPRSPTGRVPQWVIDEAVGIRPAVDGWRSWSPEAVPRPRRRRLRTAFVVLIAGAVAIGAAMLAPPSLLERPGAASPAFPHPTPGFEEADQPLGVPADAPLGGGAHAFMAQRSDGTPVAYDPCRPIHYVMRPDNAPIGGDAILHEAFGRLTSVTGLRFVYDGETDEQPSADRKPFQPDRYGDQWAPVLVTWETVDENEALGGDVAGEAGSVGVSVDGNQVFVTGAVSLDEATFHEMLTAPSGAVLARAIVLHELGHLVGLAHVEDTSQLMYPSASQVFDFAAGDLTGLVALGRGSCVPQI